MCGGTHRLFSAVILEIGLSPRVRGNHDCSSSISFLHRSIPACAGEPVWVSLGDPSPEVYPRVCGGTVLMCPPGRGLGGLSPRVRGNRAHVSSWARAWRSIPACAGEPFLDQKTGVFGLVYPRVCGGTREDRPAAYRIVGLSPRVRGNHTQYVPPRRPRGVYPRVCGGTGYGLKDGLTGLGLSPRVRGNPVQLLPGHDRGRSIPACAGEPSPAPALGRQVRVYPRVCGGTSQMRQLKGGVAGLSPRVRGNRAYAQAAHGCNRSIPACAGEPERN